jgi:iron(III) transport system substrate-binding protein
MQILSFHFGFSRSGQSVGASFALTIRVLLSQQEIQWRKGHTLISQLVAAGEFPVGIVYAHRIEAMKKASALLEWVKTSNPIFVALSPTGLATKAPHPNAGKLLLDFILSRESQQQLRAAYRLSGRMDIEPLAPEMHYSKLKLAAIDPKVSRRHQLPREGLSRDLFSLR